MMAIRFCHQYYDNNNKMVVNNNKKMLVINHDDDDDPMWGWKALPPLPANLLLRALPAMILLHRDHQHHVDDHRQHHVDERINDEHH